MELRAFFIILTIILGILAVVAIYQEKPKFEKYTSLILTLLSLFIALFLPTSPSVDNDNNEFNENTTESITEEATEEQNDGTSHSPNIEESLSTENNTSISGDSFSGTITYEDQQDYYTYSAPISGRYHFTFDISDINNPFDFSILDSRGESPDIISSSKNGVTVDLLQGESYAIYINEYMGLLEYYSVSIGIPNSEMDITGNTFGGSITYIDQIDTFNFKAPTTGVYRFTFDSSNVNNIYYFSIYDSKNEQLAYKSSSNDGSTVSLTEGESYKIYIMESDGLLDSYSVSIGLPNEPVTIDGKEFTGSINYIDQTNIYYYTAPKTGIYRFDFDYSNVNNPFIFSVFNSKQEKLADLSASNEGKTLTLEKDETYKICITEYDGLLESYVITIGTPQKTKTISNFPITGKITFTDQCNVYKFTPSYSGKYSLTFNINDTTCSYRFVILDSKKEKIKDTYSYNDTTSVNLTAGENYQIKIIQSEGYPIEYSITLN